MVSGVQKNTNQNEMAESEAIQTMIKQVAIQAATALVMALRKVDAGPRSGTCTTCLREMHRQRHGRQALK